MTTQGESLFAIRFVKICQEAGMNSRTAPRSWTLVRWGDHHLKTVTGGVPVGALVAHMDQPEIEAARDG